MIPGHIRAFVSLAPERLQSRVLPPNVLMLLPPHARELPRIGLRERYTALYIFAAHIPKRAY